MHRIIFDTDLGVDDAYAVLLAMLSPEIQIEGFTTVFGNARVEYCTQNVLYVLEMMNRTSIPVRQGSGEPLLREIYFGKEYLKSKLQEALKSEKLKSPEMIYSSPHGEKGLGDFKIPKLNVDPASGNAIAWLVDTVLASPGEIEILALGPLTNLALAVLIEPRWTKAVKRIIFMGGALTVPGNVGPLSTANIAHDPEAAKIVFHSGIPIVMVGQDVTRFARLTPSHKEKMHSANTKVTRFLERITQYYAGYYYEREPSIITLGHPIHDMLVTAYLLQPSLFETERLYVTVETQGEVTRGQTVADWREFSPYKTQMDVCMKADNEALFEFFLDRITQENP
jgi:purine nucleosidase